MVINISKVMDLSVLVITVLISSGIAQQQQQPAQFRQLQQEPQFQPPPILPQGQQQQFNFQQPQQPIPRQAQVGQVTFPQQQQQQQQNFQQNQPSFQQTQQNFQQERPQPNFNDFNNRQQQETLPTLPPVFIPPNNPIGPAPQLQSPIRNLFRQPESTFSISNIFNRFLNLFNLNSN